MICRNVDDNEPGIVFQRVGDDKKKMGNLKTGRNSHCEGVTEFHHGGLETVNQIVYLVKDFRGFLDHTDFIFRTSGIAQNDCGINGTTTPVRVFPLRARLVQPFGYAPRRVAFNFCASPSESLDFILR